LNKTFIFHIEKKVATSSPNPKQKNPKNPIEKRIKLYQIQEKSKLQIQKKPKTKTNSKFYTSTPYLIATPARVSNFET